MLPNRKPAGRQYEQIAQARCQRNNLIGRKAVPLCKTSVLFTMLAHKPIRGAEPDVPRLILSQAAHIIARKCRCRRSVQYPKTLPVKARRSIFRGNPEVPFAALQKRMNTRLGKTVFGRPHLMMKIIWRLLRIRTPLAGPKERGHQARQQNSQTLRYGSQLASASSTRFS